MLSGGMGTGLGFSPATPLPSGAGLESFWITVEYLRHREYEEF